MNVILVVFGIIMVTLILKIIADEGYIKTLEEELDNRTKMLETSLSQFDTLNEEFKKYKEMEDEMDTAWRKAKDLDQGMY